MIQHILRFGTGVVFLMVLLGSTAAQQPDKPKGPPPRPEPERDLDQYRQFFKAPTTAEGYWRRMQFEIDVGQYDLAARWLHGLVTKPPTDEDYLALEEKFGMAAFLKLRTLPPLRDHGQVVPRWSEDPKLQQQTLDDIEILIKGVTDTIKRKLADRDRIIKFVRALKGEPEEASFALKQLSAYGALVVPPLIEELRASPDADTRRILRRALIKLPAEVVPPLVAALDSNDPELIPDVIRVFKERGAKEVVPYLWYLSAAPEQPERVRKAATDVLVYFLDIPASKLPLPTVALTREAERYFHHQVAFVDPTAVKVWRWDKAGIVQGWPGAATVPQTRAEEYYGLRFARQALALDPGYQPAQEVLVALTLEKTLENVNPALPLAKVAPPIQELVTSINPDVLTAVLERAMAEKRSRIVLACVRALGDLVEVRASKPTGHGEPSLVRALYYGDARVQMAAAEALLRMPAVPSSQATQRILEILNGYLAAGGQASARPKVLVASGNPDSQQRIVKAVTGIGYEAVTVSTGRDALRRLDAAHDISAIVLESTLPDPGLASFLAQVRADSNAKRLPVVLIAVPDTAESRELVYQYRDARERLQFVNNKIAPYRKERLDLQIQYDKDRKQVEESTIFQKESERRDSLAQLSARFRDDLGVLARRYAESSVLDREGQELEGRLDAISDKYSQECQRREAALKRWLEASPTIAVISTGFLDDPKKLHMVLQGEEGKTETIPLAEAEQKEYAERSIHYLARMARGEIAGYDIKPYAETIYNALHGGRLSEKGQAEAIDLVSRLSTPRAQLELAAVVLDDKRPPALRLKAADELVKHVQQNSRLMNDDLIGRLRKLFDDAGTAPELKEKLAALQGTLRPTPQTSGERLRDFRPPAAPPKMEP